MIAQARTPTRLAAFAFTAIGTLAGAGAAQAQTCAGVEHRVNMQTSSLATAVTGTITTTEAGLIAQEVAERARLISAVRVLTAQSSAGSDQVSNGFKASSQALATTVAAQDQRQAIAAATHRYGSVGYDPCGSNTKAQSLFQAITAAPTVRGQITQSVKAQPGRYGDPGQWSAAVKSGTAPDGASLYSGDIAAATRYIDTVVGPPDQQPLASLPTGEADLQKLEKTGRDTYRSLTATVLADIAADYAPDGPIARARTLSTHWQGTDGGASWATGISGQHSRGVLQDAVRMEAANLALLATQLKRGARTEATAAALLLAMVNARLTSLTPNLKRSPIGSASYQP